MDALLSIPALSLLFITTFSSYSTTLNLLFFYLTWATLIISHTPLVVEILGTLVIRVLFYILPSLGFLLFDSALPNAAVVIKEHGDCALPLSGDDIGRKSRCWKIVLVSLGNLILGVTLQAAVESLFTKVFRIRSALKTTISLPMPWDVAKDLFCGVLIRECLTYVLHRYAIHSSPSFLRSLHMNWQHSVSPPYSIIAHYDHPLPYVLHIFVPTYVPAVLCRFHLLTYYIYLTLVSLEETFAYSGYNVLPSGFLLSGIARRREQHFLEDAQGNYGCLGLIDLIFGTSLGDGLVNNVRGHVKTQNLVNKVQRNVKGPERKIKRKTSLT